MFRHSAILAFSLAAGAASAQDAGWTYKASLYGWLPSMTTTVETPSGTIEVDQSGSDVLDLLHMAFMGTFSAQNGAWGYTGDLLYTNLEDTKSTPHGIAFDNMTVDLKLTVFSGYALYRVSNDLPVQFDAGVGFRGFDMGIEASGKGGIRPDVTVSIDESWVDPLLAARVMVPIDEKWFLSGFADLGGTGSDQHSYQIYTSIGYNFNDAWSTQLGYRLMNVNKTVNGHDVGIDLSGALIGVTYSF